MKIDKYGEFIPGETRIRYGGVYTDKKDVEAVQSVLDRNWWTLDEHGRLLEKELGKVTRSKHVTLTNSGSSALLMAFAILRKQFNGYGEVIVAGVQFPTAISSILYNSMTPVFVDVEPGTFCIDAKKIKEAIGPNTKAIMATNIAGNMPDVDAIQKIAKKNRLITILDNCDGFGGIWRNKFVENFFDISCTSFHAAHIMAMGEGGAVFTNNESFGESAQSMREWGRVGDSDENKQFRDIPADYPGRYIFVELGFNVKPLELQAAMGRTQLRKLKKIKKMRHDNFQILYSGLGEVAHRNHVDLPVVYSKADVSWFSFPMMANNRGELREFLDARNIETRTIFGGNITKQPAFKGCGVIMDPLTHSDDVMERGMFVSVHPNCTKEMMFYIVKSIKEFYG